jgi:hypothetical protein
MSASCIVNVCAGEPLPTKKVSATTNSANVEEPLWVDTVEKLNLLPRSQFLRQQVGFKKKALGVRQKG